MTKGGDLLLILPETTTPTMRILKATRASGYTTYEQVWEGTDITGEPLVDGPRLEAENVLSLFVRRDVADSKEGRRDVVVLDFVL